jgi:protein-S-isoprenylcysteine O-methyltransferase Ste14
MRRFFGIAFGLATHALFAFTVWHLFWFLKGPLLGDVRISSLGLGTALAIDALLAVAFAVPHSIFLLPAVRRRLVAAGIPAPLYGCFYSVVTCAVLLLTIFCWQPTSIVAWRWPPPFDNAVTAAFAASWGALFYSLHLTGLGWQTGWTPWWHWARGLPQPKRVFVERGAYRFLRHPVYLSFLGLIWFTPLVTLDRMVLIGVWSTYIFIGSAIKDRRLVHFMGDTYRDYQARVPGYPGVAFGPLGRVPLPRMASCPYGLPNFSRSRAPRNGDGMALGQCAAALQSRSTAAGEKADASPTRSGGLRS